MSEDQDLGPMPPARIEPGEPNPGGPDAVPGLPDADPEIPDLEPESNPATEDAPAEVKEGEDTSTEATRGEDSDGTEESSA